MDTGDWFGCHWLADAIKSENVRKSYRAAHIYCTGGSIIAKAIQFEPFKNSAVVLILQELNVSLKEPIFFRHCDTALNLVEADAIHLQETNSLNPETPGGRSLSPAVTYYLFCSMLTLSCLCSGNDRCDRSQ